MGHYASEMMCQSCGECRCKCERVDTPDPTLKQWVVDSNYNALSVPEFDAKYAFYKIAGVKMPFPGGGLALRMGHKHFDTKELAEQHALALLDKNISANEAHLAELRARRQELQSL